VPGEKRGFARVHALCEDREAAARKIRDGGGKVIGYLCSFAPPELIHAAGMVPMRILGKMGDPVAEADAHIESNICPYVRNCFEQDLKGRMDYLDGLVLSHSCDIVQRAYAPWKAATNRTYSRLFNVPHTVSAWSEEFFVREMKLFVRSLEEYQERTVTEDDIRASVRLYNQNRALVREVFKTRESDCPPVSGSEVLELLTAGMTVEPEEFRQLLLEALEDIHARKSYPARKKAPRLMVWGAVMDDPALLRMIESLGADVVTDDTCIGTRCFGADVRETGDIFEGLMERYFREFVCPRTNRGAGAGRFRYILDAIARYRVDGVVGYALSYCDVHKFDYPDLRDCLNRQGCPSVLISDDYSLGARESVRTRLQSFLEMLQSKQ